jgi:PBP1b-binding outer membrane lipoprotein LpoB
MKKVLSLIAMASIIVGLTGCMDDPDGSKQSTRPAPSKVENPYK